MILEGDWCNTTPAKTVDLYTSLLADNDPTTCKNIFSSNVLKHITLTKILPSGTNSGHILVDITGSGIDCCRPVTGLISATVTMDCTWPGICNKLTMCIVVVLKPDDRCVFDCKCEGVCDTLMVRIRRPSDSALQQSLSVCKITVTRTLWIYLTGCWR